MGNRIWKSSLAIDVCLCQCRMIAPLQSSEGKVKYMKLKMDRRGVKSIGVYRCM